MRRALIRLAPLALMLFTTPARAQVAETWLRDALTPVTPGIHKTPSSAIYPPQSVPMKFSHKVHMKGDVACESCHDMVEKSTVSADKNIPAHPQCETCHDIDAAKKGEATDPPSSCEVCHPGIKDDEVPKDLFPANNIHFSHEAHIKRGAKCTDCHSGVEKVVLATRGQLPRMATCLVCHDGNQAPNKCTVCHLTEPDGLMQTRFESGVLAPSGTLRDDDHGRDFLHRHAFMAQQDAESCNSCHRVQECESCHAASSKAFRFHPPGWVQMHGVESRSQKMECVACHREQSFCLTCHQASGVALATTVGPAAIPGLAPPARTFHPPGFMAASRTSANGPGHHSFEAMANPESCIACHDEQSCTKCHATMQVTSPVTNGPGLGINPHFPGFASSPEACRAYHQTPFACAKCHGGGSNLTMLQAQMPGCK